jgi:hypothetical protein
MNHNTPANNATSLIQVSLTHFLSVFGIDTCVGFGALSEDIHWQSAFSVPKHCSRSSELNRA